MKSKAAKMTKKLCNLAVLNISILAEEIRQRGTLFILCYFILLMRRVMSQLVRVCFLKLQRRSQRGINNIPTIIYIIFDNISDQKMRNTLQQEKGISFKIILIGDSGTGKTSLIRKYIHGTFQNQYQVTVGVDFSSKTIFVGQQPVQLQIWDTCGQDIYKAITNSFYRGAGAVFLAFALDNPQSFKKLSNWLAQFYQKGSRKALVFLIGTKSDLECSVSQSNALKFMSQHQCSFFIKTSAKQGQKVDQLFHKAAQTMYKLYKVSPEYRDLIKPDRNTLVNNNGFNNRLTLNGSVLEMTKHNKEKKCCS